MKEQIVNDTVKAMFDQAGLDERFRADFTKAVAAVYDAGAAATNPGPSTDAEKFAALKKILA